LTQLGGFQTGKRLRDAARLHLRQLPCLHAILPTLRCWKRKSYQTLGQDEEGDGAEVDDKRQDVNLIFGKLLTKIAFLAMIGLTVLFLVRSRANPDGDPYDVVTREEEFARDSPIIMYIACVELLICGACSHTAALMYRRRRHAMRHPADSTGKERQRYIKVELEKDAGLEHRQLYGLGFRPSTDGLECLIVEAVRPGSLLDQWNQRAAGPSTQQLLEEALGDELGEAGGEEPAAPAPDAEAAPPEPAPSQTVLAGAAVVAVNDVAADVGLMQLQLMRPKVTLWLRAELPHPSQLESDVLALGPLGPAPPPGSEPTAPPAFAAAPAPTFLGRPEPGAGAGGGFGAAVVAATAPRCACLALEDEEQQILTRWTVCAIIFGWVTILPVLLMQPHEQRPRQQLFRQYLLKPCLLMMPVALLMWLLDCIEILAEYELFRPLYFFGICHVVIPAVLAFYLIQMQAADEKLILEQRKSRLKEATDAIPVVMEDPAPTLLKELIEVNPVALVLLGATASIPLVAFSLLTPMQTKRGKKAQGYIHLVYAPCAFLQVFYVWVIWRIRFQDMPRIYLTGLGALVSVPCFFVWCFCLFCSYRYGREDVSLVERQRQERAQEALAAAGVVAPDAGGGEGRLPAAGLVDCSEAGMRDWELIRTA